MFVSVASMVVKSVERCNALKRSAVVEVKGFSLI